MEEIKNKIFKLFWEEQCDTQDCILLEESMQVVRYSEICSATGLPKDKVKPMVIEMRNDRFIELTYTVRDLEYGLPCGTGWILTEKGLNHCKALFFKK